MNWSLSAVPRNPRIWERDFRRMREAKGLSLTDAIGAIRTDPRRDQPA